MEKLTQLANYEHGKIKICTKPDVVSFTALLGMSRNAALKSSSPRDIPKNDNDRN